MNNFQKQLEDLYTEFEKLKTEAKEKQDRAKELKEEIIHIMIDEMGRDEVIVNGWDGMIKLEITYPEREVLNKKGLAEALGVSQKDLAKPQTWIQLTQENKITSEMIEQFTELEERMQFGAKEVKEGEEDI